MSGVLYNECVQKEDTAWWAWMDLNHRPPLYKSGALTAELHARTTYW